MADRDKLGLPPRIFMYHFDQVAAMLEIEETTFTQKYVYYKGLSSGPPSRDKIAAINLAPKGETPAWRITEPDLIRWLKFRGISFSTRRMR